MAKKILLIEDDQILSDVLAQKLGHEGYEVATEKDGEAGFAKMRSWAPDLVLLDIVMPKMNGYEVLEAKFKDPALRPIPTIVISNSGQPVEISRTTSLGAVGHLVKAHLSPEEVLAKVRLHLDIPMKRGSCKGKTVLLVEDDTFLSDLLARRFVDEQCEFLHAADGEQALDLVKRKMPDIILLDLVLPGMSGFEVLEQIKKDQQSKHIPVIVLSNLAQQTDIERALKLGALRHEVKAHLTPNEIVILVGSITEGKQ